MKSVFYLTYLTPSLIGLALILFNKKIDCHPSIKMALFLIAQIVFVHIYADVTYEAEYRILAILAGFIILATFAEESKSKIDRLLAVLLFGVYLLYWGAVKYFIPLGWLDPVAKAIRAILAAFPAWGDAISGPWLARADLIQSHAISPFWAMAGVSYIGFKLIHFFVDYRAGEIKKPKPLEFLGWLFFFPSIIAGPMIRYQEWQEQNENSAVGRADIFDGVRRIIIGLFMKVVIADSIHSMTIANMSNNALSLASWWQLVAASCLYYVYLYFDFAGYSHIAIGLARFWGMRLPENFNEPYRGRNLAEFWNRWHITLSLILRDYLFYPISLHLKRIKSLKKHLFLTAALPPLVTFIIAGIWHGAGIGFLIFGFLHGIGLAYLAVMKRFTFTGKFAQWWQKSKTAYIISAAITFLYVSMTFVFFCLSYEKLLCIWHNLTGRNMTI